MPPSARGAAFVDPTGALLAADPGFLRELGLAGPAPAAALAGRAGREPGLRALLRGEGPDALALQGVGGEPLSLERHPGAAGHLLVLRAAADQERLEHALRSQAIGPLAGGLSHDVNGPLNTMTLQLALLTEKLDGGPAGGVAAGHLAALRDQVARVHGLVRRFREAVDPPAVGATDLSALVGELCPLFTHDLHRREVRLLLDLPAGVARTSAPPERLGRLLLALLARGVGGAEPGGTLAVEVSAGGEGPVLAVTHRAAAGAPAPGYEWEVAAAAAAALGGRLARDGQDGQERITLRLPGGAHG